MDNYATPKTIADAVDDLHELRLQRTGAHLARILGKVEDSAIAERVAAHLVAFSDDMTCVLDRAVALLKRAEASAYERGMTDGQAEMSRKLLGQPGPAQTSDIMH